MNLFLILIPQSLNSQCLNLPQHSHYEEAGVQKADLFFRSNNDVCIYGGMSNPQQNSESDEMKSRIIHGACRFKKFPGPHLQTLLRV